jgi:hypothetical protein
MDYVIANPARDATKCHVGEDANMKIEQWMWEKRTLRNRLWWLVAGYVTARCYVTAHCCISLCVQRRSGGSVGNSAA